MIASPKNLEQHPVEVAFYDRLVEEAKKHLPETNAVPVDSISQVLQQIQALRNSLDAIESSVSPKKVSDKTEKRASEIAPKINDALRLLDSWGKKDSAE